MPRKRTFDPSTILEALKAVKKGTSRQEVAKGAGCSMATLNRWVKDYSEFSVQEIAEAETPAADNRYIRIMRRLFETRAPRGTTTFDWERSELAEIARDL